VGQCNHRCRSLVKCKGDAAVPALAYSAA
jgi:hypothetical protein